MQEHISETQKKRLGWRAEKQHKEVSGIKTLSTTVTTEIFKCCAEFYSNKPYIKPHARRLGWDMEG